jgi:hypothetical protein
MGEAKRRQQLDRAFGQPQPHTLTIYEANTHTEIVEIPFSVLRQPTARRTIQRGYSIAILIIGYLIEPIEINARQITAALSEDGLRSLSELAPELPKRFWANFRTPDGDDWTLATGADCLPDDVSSDHLEEFHTTDVFERAIA